MSSRQTRKRSSKRSRLDAFLNTLQEEIDEPDDYVQELEDSDDDGGEYVPSSPEVHELEDAADDNDGDDPPPPSPKMATSKKKIQKEKQQELKETRPKQQ